MKPEAKSVGFLFSPTIVSADDVLFEVAFFKSGNLNFQGMEPLSLSPCIVNGNKAYKLSRYLDLTRICVCGLHARSKCLCPFFYIFPPIPNFISGRFRDLHNS